MRDGFAPQPFAARVVLLAAAVALIAALAFGSASVEPTGAGAAAKARQCGTYKSTSYYEKARVTQVRDVSCSKAKRTAKRYDRTGRQTPPLDCRLAHGGGRRLFSCQNPGSGSGHLVAEGVGKRQD